VKAARFDYLRPGTLDEALEALAGSGGSIRVMAGSQSLGPMLNLRLVRPERLIDISGLHELRAVSVEASGLRIGAGITHAEIEDACHPALQDHPWRRVAATIAFRSVRNRGTVGGSLAHADPAADWVLTAWASGAEVEIARLGSRRLVPIRQFMQAAYTTVLGPDELISAILVPASLQRVRWGYYKVCRKIGDFAEASCAVAVDPESGQAAVAVGALDGPPVMLDGLGARVAGIQTLPAGFPDEVSEHLTRALPGLDRVDHRMVCATVMRAVERAFGREPAGTHEGSLP
jgi:carbon-monoxide dehydrogenase medium subunit